MDKVYQIVKRCQTLLWILVILLVWEMVTQLGLVNSYVLPPFTRVARQMAQQIIDGKLGYQILNSLYIVFGGMILSFLLAIVTSILCIYSKIVESFVAAVCTVMNPLPGIAILPLIMLWFGIGDGAMLILIIHGVLWPLVTNLLTGFKAIPQVYREWGINIGLSPFRMFTDIYINAVISYVISGLRVGWGRAWRALISAEMVFGMIGSLGGVGYYIYQNRAYANMTNVMVGVLVIILVGLIMEQGFFCIIEKKTIGKWGSGL